MGTKYPGNGDSGYNASPPPDDGTEVPANLVTWAGIKGKLTDILLTYIDAINSDLNDWADNAPKAKSSAYPTVADDNGRVIQTTGSPTITLGTASSMGAGYEVTIKAVSGTTTVATGETIDGSIANRTLNAGEAETYVVNEAGAAYMIKQNKAITQTETATMANKTLTSPVLNGTLSGTAFLDQDDLSDDSDIAVASQQSIKKACRPSETAAQTYDAAGKTFTFAHGLSQEPVSVQLIAECTDAGGDVSHAQGARLIIGGQSRGVGELGFVFEIDATNVKVHVASGGLNVVNTNTWNGASMTVNKWDISLLVY